MTIAVISDTHIVELEDEKHKLVQSFLSSDEVKASKTLIFLGDIFDLLVGDHEYYISKFEPFFNQLKDLLDEGKEIYFFEGNHDFHVKSLFRRYFEAYFDKSFFYIKDELILERWNKKFYFSHGDNLDIDNPSYQITKFILRNNIFKIIADGLPGKIVETVGRKWSDSSRKKSSKYFREEKFIQRVRNKFRKAAKDFYQGKNLDYIVCGHSHIEDDYLIEDKCVYLNNGFPYQSKKFILLSENGHQLQRLP